MKIVIFNTLYYPAFLGGAEISVKLLAEGLVAQGHQVYVITLGTGNRNVVNHLNGVVIIRMAQKNFFKQFINKKRNAIQKSMWMLLDSCNPFYSKGLVTILRRIRPDVVHTNNVMGFSPFVWRVIKQMKLPLLHTMRDYYLLCHKCNMFNQNTNCEKLCSACNITHQIKKNFVKYPDAIVGVSDFILKKHSDFLKFNASTITKVIYNAVDQAKESPKQNINGKITFGFMARISEDKGVGYLVDQLKIINESFPNQFRILLAGSGEDAYIKKLKADFNEIDYSFLGVMRPEEFYPKVDVSIVPSLWFEPFGRVAVESLAHGVPVCIAANGGLKEIFQERSSWLFNPGKKELSEVLTEILNDPAIIVSKSTYAREHAASFSTEKNINNYLNMYKTLLNREQI